MKFTYIKTPINKYTFKSKKIRNWVISECEGLTLNLFAGNTLLDGVMEVRNDIREDAVGLHSNKEALKYVKEFDTSLNKFQTVVLDPPYSYRKSMEFYNGKKASSFNRMIQELPHILTDTAKVITFGYNSCVMGTKRGFEIEHIALFNHGGAIHDTIATVERRIK